MADLMSRKAKFDEVKFHKEALDFHANRYANGSVDALAKQCHQWKMIHEFKESLKTPYERFTEEAKPNGINIES